jgi:hypothetical protein
VAAARRKISAGTRFRVFARDGHACVYCGRGTADGAKLVLDHEFPYALGGGDEEQNLVTACSECNSGKGATCLVPAGTTCAEYSEGTVCGNPATHVVGHLCFSDDFGPGVYAACDDHARSWAPGFRAKAVPIRVAALESSVTATISG